MGKSYHARHDVVKPDWPGEDGVVVIPCGVAATLYGPMEPVVKHVETARHPSSVGHLARAPEYCGYGHLVCDADNLLSARTDDRWWHAVDSVKPVEMAGKDHVDGCLSNSHRYLTGGGTGVSASEMYLMSPDKVASLRLTTVLAIGTLNRSVLASVVVTRWSGSGWYTAPG